ncbi:uncharacterized protein LOC119161647 isoform X3 [Rhipicephalus microplus]|uniref:uncharacterized protein LOC119161647 isoform X3 n=1 Tax=Rhipicephalus microplus TaxID=6941 RepID=UPI003F6C4E4D
MALRSVTSSLLVHINSGPQRFNFSGHGEMHQAAMLNKFCHFVMQVALGVPQSHGSSYLCPWVVQLSSSAIQSAPTQAKSWGTPLVYCAGQSISVQHGADISNTDLIEGDIMPPKQKLAAILGTCPAACADRLRLPPEIDACPLFDSSPCVDHGWPPYATLKPYYAEEASVTSSSRQTDHITGWRNPSPFSGHWIAAVMPVADNPLCLFVQLAAILGTCPAACADRLRLPPDIDACPLFDSSPCVDHGWPPYATLKPYYAEEASVTSSSRQTDHITGWRNPSPFSGHWIAAVMPAADNPLCLFVQEQLLTTYTVVHDRVLTWPEGVVFYKYETDMETETEIAFEEKAKEVIEKAMQLIQSKTCIKFQTHTDQENYVSIAYRQFLGKRALHIYIYIYIYIYILIRVWNCRPDTAELAPK